MPEHEQAYPLDAGPAVAEGLAVEPDAHLHVELAD